MTGLWQLAVSVSALVNAAPTAPAEWRAPVSLGIRYTLPVSSRVALQVGGMMTEGNAVPAFERLRFDGLGMRHWGAGLRVRTGGVTWLGSFTRTDRRYHRSEWGGYYATAAVGAEFRAGPAMLRLEQVVKTLKQWDADPLTTIARVHVWRLALMGQRATWWEEPGSLIVGTAALSLMGPFVATAGWQAVPRFPSHRLERVPILGLGIVTGR